MALAFGAAGANVVVNHRSSPAQADDVVQAIKELGADALAVEADCTVPADVDRLVTTAVNTFGEIRVLVNNAGIGGRRPFAAEVAPLITVNAIEPGIHFTDMVGQPPAEVRAALDDLFLLGLAEDRDVASMATFLASPAADHITAQIFLTSGGIS